MFRKQIGTSAGILLGIIFLASCATTSATPDRSQLEIREFQTRNYETNDTMMVMKALLNVLQDDGYIVKNAQPELGIITATKEEDIESFGQKFLAVFFAGVHGTWNKNMIIESSANVSARGNHTRVRVNFQAKKLDNRGGVVEVMQIDDEQFYQEFFSKVDKGIFIEGEQI